VIVQHQKIADALVLERGEPVVLTNCEFVEPSIRKQGERPYGLPDPSYIVGDTPIYERIFGSPAVFNRALIYRGRNLHSADIPPEAELDPHPRRGRLTLNGFLTGR